MLNGREHLNKKRTRGGMAVYTSQPENKHVSRYSPPSPRDEKDFDVCSVFVAECPSCLRR